MLFEFDHKTLSYNKVGKKYVIIMCSILLFISTAMFIILKNSLNNIRYISKETKSIIIKESDKQNEFTPDRLRQYILELNIRFPHIVYAQATLESGNFKSDIFKANSNIFGMKKATSRPTTNKGVQLDHAYYDNWRKSVDDYAMFSAAYLNEIKSESEYFEYLKQNYAEDPNYVSKLKSIIAKINKLKK